MNAIVGVKPPAPTTSVSRTTTVVGVPAPAVAARPTTVVAVAPPKSPMAHIPTWAWIAIGLIGLLIVLGIVGSLLYKRGPPANSLWTVMPGRNPTCDIAAGCDIASAAGTTNLVSSGEACRDLCNRTSGCEGALYTSGPALGGSNCWLKHFAAVPPQTTAWSDATFYQRNAPAP